MHPVGWIRFVLLVLSVGLFVAAIVEPDIGRGVKLIAGALSLWCISVMFKVANAKDGVKF